MKFITLITLTLFPWYCLTGLFTPPAKAQRVVDPVPPSVIEIPPLSEESIAPEAELFRILEQERETDAAFREQVTSPLAPEFLNRLNGIIEGSQAQNGTIDRIRSSLDPARTTFETPTEIPVESIVGEN